MILPDYCYLSTMPLTHTDQWLSWLKQQGVILPSSLHRAVLKRQCEFLTGRLCARQALEAAGVSTIADIGIGDFREPLWPEGIVGAITHSNDRAAAVVIKSETMPDVKGVGIDIEQVMKEDTAANLRKQILLPQEMDYSRYFPSFAAYATLVFSAKESIYKAIFPRVRKILDFNCAAVTGADSQCIVFTLQEDISPALPAGMSFRVLYELSDQSVQTFVVF
ncbi:4'-phosphopantetheinyl transferase Npt [Vibrio aerogenes CECT 7868]|uniref:Enterobactin synthase component D n=1 Tax=Vibrio aerogenes CECT 7868 TaxID=1216006 RepID=A0A1M5XRX8_9VIBR|nr:4'-phosphopantetheinyl transferase superfamily protein [Vibrio aerogenes]SHI02516.1 4'-phosphopantetheinyl transferase Npt [Vibrio aerogenes CECT 7868]